MVLENSTSHTLYRALPAFPNPLELEDYDIYHMPLMAISVFIIMTCTVPKPNHTIDEERINLSCIL